MSYYNVTISAIKSKSVIATETILTTDQLHAFLIEHGADADDLIDQNVSTGYQFISDDNAATVSIA